jgi:hypothetical protein
MAVVMKIALCQDITFCNPLKIGTCHVHFQGQGMNEASSPLYTGVYLSLFFDPENEGYMFPQQNSSDVKLPYSESSQILGL